MLWRRGGSVIVATPLMIVFSSCTCLPVGGNTSSEVTLPKLANTVVGDLIEIYYLQSRPKKYAGPGSKGELGMFVFLLLIFLFMVFTCFKIHEEIKNDPLYQFKLLRNN